MFNRLKDILRKKELDEDYKDTEFEKGDFLAILIALSMYMIPAAIIVFGIFILITRVIFGGW